MINKKRIGHNTNLAFQPEQACQPGAVYLFNATWGLAKKVIYYEDVGTIEVKGFQYPIQTYRVLQDGIGMAAS